MGKRRIVQNDILCLSAFSAGGAEMPRSKVLSFTDPFPYQAAIQACDVELYPTAKGDFRAELTKIRMNQLWMSRYHEKLPEIYASKVRPGRKIIGFLTEERQPTLRNSGIEVSPRDIFVNDNDVMHHRTEGDCSFGTMSLPLDDFDVACKTIAGSEYPGSSQKHFVRPNPALMSRLLKLHEVVGQIAKTTPDLLELPEVVRSLEQELIRLMVRCLTEGASSTGMTRGGRRHDAIVARFEGFLEANPDQPLYLTEICAAIGVSERTLRVACEEHLGMGPIRYLSLRRMYLVRRALLQADPSTVTVTRLATDHGFWELGRFAVAYRKMFGESPSESLQRPPQDQRIFQNRPSSFENTLLHA
jgi:AraC-like DNA-binding protein